MPLFQWVSLNIVLCSPFTCGRGAEKRFLHVFVHMLPSGEITSVFFYCYSPKTKPLLKSRLEMNLVLIIIFRIATHKTKPPAYRRAEMPLVLYHFGRRSYGFQVVPILWCLFWANLFRARWECAFRRIVSVNPTFGRIIRLSSMSLVSISPVNLIQFRIRCYGCCVIIRLGPGWWYSYVHLAPRNLLAVVPM